MKQVSRPSLCALLWVTLLTMAGCGDENNPAVAGCGGCPANYACTLGPQGPVCQPPYSRDQGMPDASLLPAENRDDEPGFPAAYDGNDDEADPEDDGRDWVQGRGNGNDDGGACAEVRLVLKPSQGSIPRVMLVVDRSYSMVVEEDRWSPIERTLSRVTQNLGDTVQFGLVLFPAPNPAFRGSEAEMACAAGEVNVAPGMATAVEINRWLSTSPPERGLATPTYSALDAAGRSLMAAPTGNDYILLATDGGPGCNFTLNHNFCTCLNHACILGLPEMCLDDNRTVTKVQDLARAGIKTIVLGIASEEFMPESRAVLDRMAVAGQTDLDGRHFEVGRVDDLEQSLTAAAGNLAPCTYDLGALANEADRLVLTIDGQDVPRDRAHQNGWDLTGNSVEFYGASCQSLRDGRAHEISATCQ